MVGVSGVGEGDIVGGVVGEGEWDGVDVGCWVGDGDDGCGDGSGMRMLGVGEGEAAIAGKAELVAMIAAVVV